MQAGERANYFYCVRVTNPDIHSKIEGALEWILDKDPQYTDFCYTKEMLHVTLWEVSLQTEDEIAQASQILQDVKQDLAANLPSSKLCLKGISDFHKKVMIAKVEYEQDYRQFAELLKSKLKSKGIRVNEAHDFTPHMTILKVSGMKARKAKVDNINPWLYANLKDTLFGSQKVSGMKARKANADNINPWLYVNLKDTLFGSQKVKSLHLCKMGRERRGDGFYKTPSEIFFKKK